MRFRDRIYDLAVHAALPLLGVARPVSAKLNRAITGWHWSAAILEEWAAEARAVERPLAWLHSPSVGEALMAKAIMAELRRLAPELQLVFTHFSASAERIADELGADVAAFLPLDTGRHVRRALAALQPSVIAFVRTEIWPGLTREASEVGVPVALVNGVLSEGSRRLRGPGPWLLGPAYARLAAVGAVAEEDARRFSLLGVPAHRVRVTGDARFDQVWARVGGRPAAGRDDEPPQPKNQELIEALSEPGRTTVVAGSTWPGDQARLLPAFARLNRESPSRLIIAPHEPDDRHLRGLEAELRTAGLNSIRLASVGGGESLPEVVIVDRVGVLADLYAAGEVAYVGGGFRAAGLHSVVEPAALARPVLFGPRPGNAREAAELERAGGGFTVRDTDELADRLFALARSAAALSIAGAAAQRFVRSRLGGAAANAELIHELLRQHSARRGSGS